MRTPSWAPEEVVALYQALEVKSHGRSSWELQTKRDIVRRLITDDTMKSEWAWMREHHNPTLSLVANGGIVGRILRAVEVWDSSQKLPAKERKSALESMARSARQLSRKMQALAADSNSDWLFLPTSLVPSEYDKVLSRWLNPELVASLANRRHALRMALLRLQPPIYDQLRAFADVVERSGEVLKPPRSFPRKIRAKRAFQNFMVNTLVNDIPLLTGEHPPPWSRIAQWATVTLDDDRITPDTIKKSSAAAERGRFLEK
ncbi:MAG: hypothetical protein MUC55_04410 [Burkholderiales bacterium]|jgi:hypothetical protein|nr:hypothetical protein [Burkholderiales bacterium]